MFVVFEGIDGSGKTTISNLVTAALRGTGLVVEHLREGGRFASGVAQGIRDFARDARNVDLLPHAEFLLYVAREVQLMDEATRPLLERADVVIADRFLYSAAVLAQYGRGLPPQDLDPVLRMAARGLAPDLVFLIDLDPQIARARRRIAKILTRDTRAPSRKGLTGAGLLHRLRDGYRRLAEREPERWITVDNDHADLDSVVAHIIDVLAVARRVGSAAAASYARGLPAPASERPQASCAAEALDAFLAWIDPRMGREPHLAAYLLGGMCGARLDDRRAALVATAPETMAYGLRQMTDAMSWQLRRALCGWVPHFIASSLTGPAAVTDEARRLRAVLAPRVPAEVAESLDGLDDQAAWALRDELYRGAPDAVVASLRQIDHGRAWALRHRWLAERGGEVALTAYETARAACRSVAGVDDERAWRLRAVARDAAPVAAVLSVTGLGSERAWKWRERYLDLAPRSVLATLTAMDDPRAWEMRESVATRCKEALDSMSGLDGPTSWRIRESCADLWPSTVVKSLGLLAATPQGAALLDRQVAHHGRSIAVLKHAAALATRLSPDLLAA